MKKMFEHIVRFGKELLTLKQQVEKNTCEIKEIRQDLQELAKAVQIVSFNIQRYQDNNDHERDKLILRLENYLLRYLRNIPACGDGDKELGSQREGDNLPPSL